MIRNSVLIAGFLTLFAMPHVVADDKDRNDGIRKALWAEFYANQARFSLTAYELSSLMGDMVIGGRALDKGGVGVIRDDIFIYVEGERNSMSLNGKIWTGKKSHVREVVFLNTDGTRSSEKTFDTNSGIVVFFSPEAVRFIDFTNNTGSRYVRQSKRSTD